MGKERWDIIQIMPPAIPSWVVYLPFKEHGGEPWAMHLQGWALRKRMTYSDGRPCEVCDAYTGIDAVVLMDQCWLEVADEGFRGELLIIPKDEVESRIDAVNRAMRQSDYEQ